MLITKQWLKEKNACPKGLKWFAKNYPDGMVLNKSNIAGLFKKLLGRIEPFDNMGIWMGNNEYWDLYYTMGWLLEQLVYNCDLKSTHFFVSNWNDRNLTLKIDLWWATYKEYKK